jgi:hypothetical protein
MGVGATNTEDRVKASVGLLNATDIEFRLAADVPNGGVLLSLPALLAVGLLRHTQKHFELPPGFYQLESIFLLLAFMALARVKSIEDLRYCSPGEWGNLLGLDRIPEVRTLRGKLKLLTQDEAPAQWSTDLSADWMRNDQASIFYVDGHVRVYTGDKANLPRHYVSRQKLCLSASADYWVNALGGQPFFVVHQDVDPKLIQVLQTEILPRLLLEVPNQPTEEQLRANPLLHRFTVVYDREGYSPKLMADLWKLRVACLTYNKNPGDDWNVSEFIPYEVTLASGECEEMLLAEDLVFHEKHQVWVREIRKLTKSGHQTSILCTDYLSGTAVLAGAMFARWCQENYFKYMRQEFNLDRIIQYGVESIPETTKVVNPNRRRLDGEVRKTAALLSRKRAELQAASTRKVMESKQAALELRMGELLQDIEVLDQDLAALKQKRKETPKHITAGDLPQEERLNRLVRQSKHFIDTIKMIAYRAETAMTLILREKNMMSRKEDARHLLRSIYQSEADLIPNETERTLTVQIHHPATRSAAAVIRHLCDELNPTETIFPGTNLRMVFELVSPLNPRDQEV